MAVNPFLRGIIRKKIDAKSFKGGMKERKELSDSAGVKGFSKWEMERKLKEAGYDMKKRKGIMKQVLEKKSDKISEKIKERNLQQSRIESRIAATAGGGTSARVAGHGSFAGGKVETRSRVAVDREGVGKTSSGFGLSSSPSSNQGMINPSTTIGNSGPKKFL